MDVLVAILGGYLLGSVSPSYILGRLLQRIDIRKHGTGNAGTLNVYKVLGLWPAVVTAAYDLLKGLLAMFVCHKMGGAALAVHLAGLAAIAGHVFPFYLKFRGGQGVATATAMMIYYLSVFYLRGWLPLSSLGFLAVAVVSFSYITRKGEVVGLVILPVLSIFALVFSPLRLPLFFLLSLLIYILSINIINIRREKLLLAVSVKDRDVISWRLYLRPAAFVLVLFYLLTDKKQALTVIGSIALFFILPDFIRLVSSKVNVFFFQKIKKVYRHKERKKFSSITIFLLALFLTILFFEKSIAALAASFLIFGDFFSKWFGLLFGRHQVFEKTWEGSLAHLNACLLAGYVLLHYLSLAFPVFVIGAATASISELLPLGVDDNFSVSLVSAAAMSVSLLF
ncbi:MAG: glycerol-3-phosphate acyltransferase [Candidatus Aminicenantales bacterium]